MTITDITEKFRSSIAELPLGCMIASSKFSLDDAMSAIELMEPKMDPGCDLVKREAELQKTRDRILTCVL